MAKKKETPPQKKKLRKGGGKKAMIREIAIAAAVGALQNKLPASIEEKTKGFAPAIALALASKVMKSPGLLPVAAYSAGRAVAALIPALQGEDETLEQWAHPSITGRRDFGVELVQMSGEEDDWPDDVPAIGYEVVEDIGDDYQELSEDYLELGEDITSIDPESLRADVGDVDAMIHGDVEEVSQEELDSLVRAASMSGFLTHVRARAARTARTKQRDVALTNASRYSSAAKSVTMAAQSQTDPVRRSALMTVGRRLSAAARANRAAAGTVSDWKEDRTITRTAGERIVPDVLK